MRQLLYLRYRWHQLRARRMEWRICQHNLEQITETTRAQHDLERLICKLQWHTQKRNLYLKKIDEKNKDSAQ